MSRSKQISKSAATVSSDTNSEGDLSQPPGANSDSTDAAAVAPASNASGPPVQTEVVDHYSAFSMLSNRCLLILPVCLLILHYLRFFVACWSNVTPQLARWRSSRRPWSQPAPAKKSAPPGQCGVRPAGEPDAEWEENELQAATPPRSPG